MVEITETLSFRNAARKMKITQPSLSTCIKQLEDELGVQLFQRSTKSVQLTEVGRVFARNAEAILNEVSRTVKQIERYRTGESGILRIGFSKIDLSDCISRAVSEFARTFAEVRIYTKMLEENSLYARLSSGDVDAIFTVEALPRTGFEILPIFRDQLCLMVHDKHRLARRKQPVNLTQLKEENFVTLRDSRCSLLSRRIQSVLDEAGVRESNRYYADSATSSIPMITSGLCVCFAPSILTRYTHNLVAIPLEKTIEVSCDLVWKVQENSLTLSRFVQLMKTSSLT